LMPFERAAKARGERAAAIKVGWDQVKPKI